MLSTDTYTQTTTETVTLYLGLEGLGLRKVNTEALKAGFEYASIDVITIIQYNPRY